MRSAVGVGASQGGAWALAPEYFGDVDLSIGEPPITYTVTVIMSLSWNSSAAPNGIPPEGCLDDKPPGS
jgi:hypothetical protein